MSDVTPGAVIEQFNRLSGEGQGEFLRLFGKQCLAEHVWRLLNELTQQEQWRFHETLIVEGIVGQVFPLMLKHAVTVVREMPSASDDELCNEINERVKRITEAYEREIADLTRVKIKEQRDRRSDEETVRRNVEMCDLRLKDRKQWSLKRLAKKYGISIRAVTLVLQQEAKWRRLVLLQGRK
jgi:hypothetical protein